ncbi:MAG: hypothetical protein CGU28_03150 [Candidatus Dactylopiibacterium carminicum]|uniref:Uncharacterized protein n=1 Tax=Candidatus Dactylopiibacterium carminicum TaxID=857335 RepID=A0A272EYN9_9RHOO|nr:hypothetical protein [Candidatus Dactylopiibacterium carminicum]KAF7600618.1 hypothetical protein BGI27_01675 [Candidatus Dactylopiibacterium carminicum]PAS95146.1 MAG: hypothetical protein CGU29_01490 [Candidatus Dactylopiibacterium carminicum]PAS97951.1 MAG: hypothetical protein CGU28_03150 [Candidatus Dactylopiibacterium carminicum]PAT00616.1 MAG: hypothetical protein BSR46_01685 [Candidatus Dactylopiibacterium carminicum]
MTALTKNRNTPSRGTVRAVRGYPLGAAARAFAGGIAVLNAAGFAVPATTATARIALGRFAAEVDNSAGANGAASVEVERGVFRFDNSADADLITLADVGKRCYLVDDQTVAKTGAVVESAATRSVAGYVDDVDDQGVWVLLDPTSGASA